MMDSGLLFEYSWTGAADAASPEATGAAAPGALILGWTITDAFGFMRSCCPQAASETLPIKTSPKARSRKEWTLPKALGGWGK
jgi:hypothetical protein